MLRSLSAVLAVLAISGSAHAVSYNDWRTHNTTVNQNMRPAFRAAQNQASQQKQRQTDEALRRQQRNRNDDQARRQLGVTRADKAQKFESPFVRPNSVKMSWDARGLGQMTHGSTIAQQHSIYDRLRTQPVPLRQQLAARQPSMGWFGRLFSGRASSMLNAGVARTQGSQTASGKPFGSSQHHPGEESTKELTHKLASSLPQGRGLQGLLAGRAMGLLTAGVNRMEGTAIWENAKEEARAAGVTNDPLEQQNAQFDEKHRTSTRDQQQLAEKNRRLELRRQEAAQRSMFEGFKG